MPARLLDATCVSKRRAATGGTPGARKGRGAGASARRDTLQPAMPGRKPNTERLPRTCAAVRRTGRSAKPESQRSSTGTRERGKSNGDSAGARSSGAAGGCGGTTPPIRCSYTAAGEKASVCPAVQATSPSNRFRPASTPGEGARAPPVGSECVATAPRISARRKRGSCVFKAVPGAQFGWAGHVHNIAQSPEMIPDAAERACRAPFCRAPSAEGRWRLRGVR